jgi:hypothetical protein
MRASQSDSLLVVIARAATSRGAARVAHDNELHTPPFGHPSPEGIKKARRKVPSREGWRGAPGCVVHDRDASVLTGGTPVPLRRMTAVLILHDFLDHLTFDKCQALFATEVRESELMLIQPQLVEDGRVDVA